MCCKVTTDCIAKSLQQEFKGPDLNAVSVNMTRKFLNN